MYRFGGITLPYSLIFIALAIFHLVAGMLLLVLIGFQWDKDEGRTNGVAPCDEPLQTWILVLGIACAVSVIPSLCAGASLFKLYGNYRRELRSPEPGTQPPDVACNILSSLFIVLTFAVYIFELAWFMIGNVWFYSADRKRCDHVWLLSFVTVLVGYAVLVIAPLITCIASTCWIVETANRKEVPRIPPPPTVILRGGGPPRGVAHHAVGDWSSEASSSSDDDFSDDDIFPTRAAIEQQVAAAALQAQAARHTDSQASTAEQSRASDGNRRPRRGGSAGRGRRGRSPRRGDGGDRGRSRTPASRRAGTSGNAARRSSSAPGGRPSGAGGGPPRRPTRPAGAGGGGPR